MCPLGGVFRVWKTKTPSLLLFVRMLNMKPFFLLVTVIFKYTFWKYGQIPGHTRPPMFKEDVCKWLIHWNMVHDKIVMSVFTICLVYSKYGSNVNERVSVSVLYVRLCPNFNKIVTRNFNPQWFHHFLMKSVPCGLFRTDFYTQTRTYYHTLSVTWGLCPS